MVSFDPIDMAIAAHKATIDPPTQRMPAPTPGDLDRAVVEGLDIAILVLDATGTVIETNAAACRTLLVPYDHLVGTQADRLEPSLAPDQLAKLRLRPGGPTHHIEATLNRPMGDPVPVELSLSAVEVESGSVTIVSARDIGDRKRAEHNVREKNAQLQSRVEELERRGRDIRRINEMGELLQICQTYEEVYTVVAQTTQKTFPGHSGALYLMDDSRMTLSLATQWGTNPPPEQTLAPSDCWALRRGRVHGDMREGSWLVCSHVSPTAKNVPGYLCVPLSAQGETIGLLHIRRRSSGSVMNALSDITDGIENLASMASDHISLALTNIRLRQTLSEQAIRDPLTKLFNRRHMEESLDREIHRAGRKGSPLGVIMIDIDHFKRFNDEFGHAAGDATLQAVSQVLLDNTRQEDIACRYGGEELLLILTDSGLESTAARAEQLRQKIESLDLRQNNQSLGRVTASFGVGAMPAHGRTVREVLGAADSAVYKAKESGRNCVIVATQRKS